MLNKKIAALLFLSTAYTVPSVAAQVQFHSDLSLEEKKIVTSLFGDYLAKNPSIKVQTSIIDLLTGTGSLAVKFESENLCNARGCYTTILKYNGTIWQKVFEKATKTLETLGPSTEAGGAGQAQIRINGSEVFIWTGLTRYVPDLRSLGKVFEPTGMNRYADGTQVDSNGKPAPASLVTPARVAMGEMLNNPVGNIEYFASPLNIGPGTAWVVEAKGFGVCTQVLGCPTTILYPNSNRVYQPLFSGYMYQLGAVMPATSEGGMHDIALIDSEGYHVNRFDKGDYKIIYTSYPSSITPIP